MALYMRGGEVDPKTGKRKGGIYWYDFYRNNQRYYGTTKKRTIREAQDFERKKKNEVDDGTYVSGTKGRVTFADYVPRVLDHVRLRHPDKPNTLAFYRNNFEQICKDKRFAALRLTEINESHLTDFALAQKKVMVKTKDGRKHHLREATINRRLASIRKLLKLAQREKMIAFPPHVDLLAGERKREYVIVGKERETFLAGLNEPYRSITEFLFETGLRVSEATSLTWNNVVEDPRGAYVKVPFTVAKSKKERHVPLSERALVIVKRQRSLSKSSYVFVRYGESTKREFWYVKPISRVSLTNQFRWRKEEMGLPWDAVLHSTRHSALTELGASGAGAFTIMSIAGHANVTTSQRYVHPISDELRQSIERKERYQEVMREREEKANAVGAGKIQ